nr:molybdopterin cofactor-binding domain-containing protein [uncultured Acetobacterium sp.]
MKKRGRGVGSMWYGIGNTGLPNPAAAFVEVLGDGTANLMFGAADIGQGSGTTMAQIAAEALGISYEKVRVTWGDTRVTPDGGATSASRQTLITGNAVLKACEQAKATLADVAAAYLGCPPRELDFSQNTVTKFGDATVTMTYQTLMAEMKTAGKMAVGAGYYNPTTTTLDPGDMSGIPYEVYSYATTICEVEVDTETGEVDVLKVVSAHDVGQTINQSMVEGQIEGGTVMGQGFVLMEEIEVSEKDGSIKNPIFSKYIIPSNLDVPEIYPILVESEGGPGPFGAKGVGEPALIPIIPAIVSAIEDALEVRFTKLPVFPKDIVAAVKKKEANTQNGTN